VTCGKRHHRSHRCCCCSRGPENRDSVLLSPTQRFWTNRAVNKPCCGPFVHLAQKYPLTRAEPGTKLKCPSSQMLYILYPLSTMESIHNYQVHPHLNCGSFHSLQSVALTISHAPTLSFWTPEWTSSFSHWTPENIVLYKSSFDHYDPPNISSQKELASASKDFTARTISTRSSFTTTTHKPQAPKPIKHNKEFSKLIQEKHSLMNSVHLPTNRLSRPDLWAEIHDVNNRIHKSALSTFIKEHEWWWKGLASLDCSNDTTAFWKLVKRLRRPLNNLSFPSLIH
jgi:hypothetical protein